MKLLLQLIFLGIAFTFIGLMYCFRFAPPANLVNHEFRPFFLKSTLLRTVFWLRQVGDARYQIASTSPLIIAVKTSTDVTPNPDLTNWLTQMVQDTLHHPVQVIYNSNAPALIHLEYRDQSPSAPTNAGQAINPTDMVIFTQTINSLSERPHIRAMLEQSTLMHEWGHLLGLNHVPDEACIMNERVEVYGNRRFQGNNLPTTFCPEELEQLKHLLE